MKATLIKTAVSSILLGLAVTSVAEAGSLASAVVTIDNFTISRGGTVLNANQFSSLNFTSSSDVAATLGGTTISDDDNSSNGAAIDLYASVGIPGPANNAFPELTAGSGVPGPVGANFAVSDTYEFGSPIAGLGTTPLFTDNSGDPTFLGVASYVSLTGEGSGSAQSNNGLQALFSFSLTNGGALDFQFDVNPFVESYLESGMLGFAEAAISVTFGLFDSTGASVLDTASSVLINPFTGEFSLVASRSSGAPGTGNSNIFNPFGGGATTLGFSTTNLIAGQQYQLSARMTAAADAEFIPEPGMVALLGIGMLGMSASLRKRNMAV